MTKYRKPRSTPPKKTDAVDQEDAFVAKTLEVTHWAQRNRPLLTLAVVIVGIGVASLVYYGRYRTQMAGTAATTLEELHQRIAVGDDAASVRADLEVFLQRYGGTPSADEARIVLGQLAAELGDLGDAVAVLEPMAGDVRDPLGAQAATLLAAVAEDDGNLRTAEALYERLADRAALGFQVRDALADAARLRRTQGDDEAALALYDRLLEDMDELDPGRGVFEMRRAEIVASLR